MSTTDGSDLPSEGDLQRGTALVAQKKPGNEPHRICPVDFLEDYGHLSDARHVRGDPHPVTPFEMDVLYPGLMSHRKTT